jgi:hypothetical protein
MEEKVYESKDVAEEFGCARVTVIRWARNNGVGFVGEDHRKTYKFTETDKEAFKNRDTKRGRRWK